MLNKPPMNENTIPIPKAFPASPLSTIGYPSKVVAMEAAVPGIFNSIAEIKPPEAPPINNPIIIATPFTASNVYVIGRHKATAIAVFNPGTAPNIIPKITPEVIKKTVWTEKTEAKPALIISIILAFSSLS